jgi:hypothetical protein
MMGKGSNQDVIDWLNNPKDQRDYQAWLDQQEAESMVYREHVYRENDDDKDQ